MDIAQMNPEQVIDMWKEGGIQRGVGLKAAKRLVDTAKKSIGLTEGLEMARQELRTLMSQYDLLQGQINQLEMQIGELLTHIPGAAQMLRIPGLGLSTVAGFLAEVGDRSRFTSWHQIRKTRVDNALKAKQSLIALCGKLIRILFAIGTRQVDDDPSLALDPAYRQLMDQVAV